MLDYVDRLRTEGSLHALLTHYARLAEAGREVWQDRLMALDGVDTAGLSGLHGQLIAYDWIEQNTGQVGPYKAGVITSCYRVTPAGLRALRLAQSAETDDESAELAASAPDASLPNADARAA